MNDRYLNFEINTAMDAKSCHGTRLERCDLQALLKWAHFNKILML